LLKKSGIAFLSSIERLRTFAPFSPSASSFAPAASDSGESTVTFFGSGSPFAVVPKNEPPADVKSG